MFSCEKNLYAERERFEQWVLNRKAFFYDEYKNATIEFAWRTRASEG